MEVLGSELLMLRRLACVLVLVSEGMKLQRDSSKWGYAYSKFGPRRSENSIFRCVLNIKESDY